MRFPWQKKQNPPPVKPVDKTVACRVYTLSETGPVRTGNEDNLVFFYPDSSARSLFAMVADGMGGHQAGEVASAIACDTAKDFVYRHHTDMKPPVLLNRVIQEIHRQIQLAAAKDAALAGMGTTAVMVFMVDQQLYFAHVGDSRLYYYDKMKTTQLTTDHTLVNQLVDEGSITAAEAAQHPQKNVLLQALGTVASVKPEVSKEPLSLQQGQRCFLCSDGVYDAVTPGEIGQLLQMTDPAFALDALRAICMQRRAQDNFTAIIIDIATYRPEPVTREQTVMYESTTE
ncbi:serine/threonine-protein phosphatase [Nostoc ellipsosporum NOK]|nr:serine/threonine-protein phosphatase [Nostoc ellipsosporum NOK]